MGSKMNRFLSAKTLKTKKYLWNLWSEPRPRWLTTILCHRWYSNDQSSLKQSSSSSPLPSSLSSPPPRSSPPWQVRGSNVYGIEWYLDCHTVVAITYNVTIVIIITITLENSSVGCSYHLKLASWKDEKENNNMMKYKNNDTPFQSSYAGTIAAVITKKNPTVIVGSWQLTVSCPFWGRSVNWSRSVHFFRECMTNG